MSTATIATAAPTLTDDQERAWLAHLSACLTFGRFTEEKPIGLTDFDGTHYWTTDKRNATEEVLRTRANFHAIRVRDRLGNFTWADRTWRLGRDGFEAYQD